jgi:hypothetical protein
MPWCPMVNQFFFNCADAETPELPVCPRSSTNGINPSQVRVRSLLCSLLLFHHSDTGHVFAN